MNKCKITILLITAFIGGLYGYLSGPQVALFTSPLIGTVGGLIAIGIDNDR